MRIERRRMPNDSEGLHKAFVDLEGESESRFSLDDLRSLLATIYDYEDEKYRETGKGRGREYTREALLDLVHCHRWNDWLNRWDPQGFMCSRRTFTVSQQKLRIAVKDDSVFMKSRRQQSGLFPSFADIYRLIQAFSHIYGSEVVEWEIQQS